MQNMVPAYRNIFTRNCAGSPQVLGYVLQAAGDDQSDVDRGAQSVTDKQWKDVEHVASRLQHLSISETYRWQLFRSLICPKLAWAYSAGVRPTQKAASRYKALLKQCLQGARKKTSLSKLDMSQGDLFALAQLASFRVCLRWIQQNKSAPLGNLRGILKSSVLSCCPPFFSGFLGPNCSFL